MDRKIIGMLAAAALFVCAAGCAPNNSLPSGVTDVGGTIVKDDDTLLPDAPSGNLDTSSVSQSNPFQENDLPLATVDDIKDWLSPVVTGEYQSSVDEKNNTVEETATTNSGGTVTILSMAGGYYNTSFRKDNADIDSIEQFLSAYIGRPVAGIEHEELTRILSGLKTGDDVVYLTSMSATASVYFIKDEVTTIVVVQ